MIPFAGLIRSSLVDYPGKITAVVFTQGCNFCCPYCHNPELIANSSNTHITYESFFSFLKTRQGLLDAVTISGGEPTLHNDLPGFINEIKKLGFFIKLDTNGSNPQMLSNLFPSLDYIAMDIKSPLEKYPLIARQPVSASSIIDSIALIQNSGIPYEFRTTYVEGLLTPEDIIKIKDLFVQNAPAYYIQQFKPTNVLDPSFHSKTGITENQFLSIKKEYIKNFHTLNLR